MRSIFTSQRVETAEGVAQRLRDAGIEVHVTNGRSYRSRRSGQFSYMDKRDPKREPTVWIVHAEDQVRAREILRATGLLDTTRQDPGQATALSFADVQFQPARKPNWGWRIRIALLLVIAAVALVILLRRPTITPAEPVQADQPVPAVPEPEREPGVGENEFRVRITPAR